MNQSIDDDEDDGGTALYLTCMRDSEFVHTYLADGPWSETLKEFNHLSRQSCTRCQSERRLFRSTKDWGPWYHCEMLYDEVEKAKEIFNMFLQAEQMGPGSAEMLDDAMREADKFLGPVNPWGEA